MIKPLLFAAAALICIVLAFNAFAAIPEPKTVPQYVQCGVPPVPPVGCSSQNAVCLCAAEGQCQWVFMGCR